MCVGCGVPCYGACGTMNDEFEVEMTEDLLCQKCNYEWTDEVKWFVVAFGSTGDGSAEVTCPECGHKQEVSRDDFSDYFAPDFDDDDDSYFIHQYD